MLENFLTIISTWQSVFTAWENGVYFIIIPLFALFFWGQYFFFQKKLRKNFHLEKIALLFKNTSLRKIIIKQIFFLLAIFSIVLAYMNPQWGIKKKIAFTGSDIILLIDVSNSMLVEDIKPNRLERAKLSILSFLENTQDSRVGIVVFAGSAYLLAPLTKDYGAVKKFIDTIDTTIIHKQGTDLALGLDIALSSFQENKLNGSKVILVFTDGENHSESIFNQGELARKKNIKIFSIGIGTGNGEFIPIKNSQGEVVSYLKDNQGIPIVSKLDQKTLITLAQITEGDFFFTERNFSGIGRIYNKINSLIGEKSKDQIIIKEDRYQIFLLLALVFFLFDLMMTTRKNQIKKMLHFFKK